MSLVTTDDVGWIVPEESIYDVLQGGLADLRSQIQAGLLERFSQGLFKNMKDERFAHARQCLADNQRLHVTFGWPNPEKELPCWAIVSDPEQSEQFIGDQGGRVTGEEGEQVLLRSERWRSGIAVVTCDTNADSVRWLHQLSKWILSHQRTALAKAGFSEIAQSSRDLTFDPRFQQAGHLYYRRAAVILATYQQNSIEAIGAENISEVQTDADVVGGIAANFSPPA